MSNRNHRVDICGINSFSLIDNSSKIPPFDLFIGCSLVHKIKWFSTRMENSWKNFSLLPFKGYLCHLFAPIDFSMKYRYRLRERNRVEFTMRDDSWMPKSITTWFSASFEHLVPDLFLSWTFPSSPAEELEKYLVNFTQLQWKGCNLVCTNFQEMQ